MRVYYYASGDEDVVNTEISIDRLYDITYTMYIICFKQEAIEIKYFRDIKTSQSMFKRSENIECDGEMMFIKTITLTIKTILNPKPEDLFEIIY
jgi:hypothetical protein